MKDNPNAVAERRREESFAEVYKVLPQLPICNGTYDAEKGSEHFMYGVETVMEVIAMYSNKYDEFSKLFAKNMEESRSRAKRNTGMEKEK